jgi:hypothetical protein
MSLSKNRVRSRALAVLSKESGKVVSEKPPKCERARAAIVLLKLPVAPLAQSAKSGTMISESGARYAAASIATLQVPALVQIHAGEPVVWVKHEADARQTVVAHPPLRRLEAPPGIGIVVPGVASCGRVYRWLGPPAAPFLPSPGGPLVRFFESVGYVRGHYWKSLGRVAHAISFNREMRCPRCLSLNGIDSATRYHPMRCSLVMSARCAM